MNLATRTNDASSANEFQYRWHGLAVAGTALGTTLIESIRRITNLPIKLAFANIVKEQSGKDYIEPTTLNSALDFVRDNASIGAVNASFLVPNRVLAMDSAIENSSRQVVVVVAAGNDGTKLSSQDAWPAMYGGRPENAKGTVVTVGAHDKDGTLASFSRWDEDYVDILAPGCEIPSYTGTGTPGGIERAEWAGTSFAAPLVSFTAGLLRAYGLNPNEIKAH